MSIKSKIKSTIIKLVLIIIYSLLLIYEIIMINESGCSNDDFFLILMSITTFIIPFISLFIPKQIFHILYIIGEALYKKSPITPMYEWDAYKKYDKICIGMLITAIFFIGLGVIIKLI